MREDNSDEILRTKLDLAEIRIKLRHAEAIIIEKTQEIDKVNTKLNMQEGELKRTVQELNSLNTVYEVTKERLRQTETMISVRESKLEGVS